MNCLKMQIGGGGVSLEKILLEVLPSIFTFGNM